MYLPLEGLPGCRLYFCKSLVVFSVLTCVCVHTWFFIDPIFEAWNRLSTRPLLSIQSLARHSTGTDTPINRPRTFSARAKRSIYRPPMQTYTPTKILLVILCLFIITSFHTSSKFASLFQFFSIDNHVITKSSLSSPLHSGNTTMFRRTKPDWKI